jgi:peptide/nickel transport system substrate-binding protein
MLSRPRQLSRRVFLQQTLALAAVMSAACAPQAPAAKPTEAPAAKPTEAAKPTAPAAAATTAPAAAQPAATQAAPAAAKPTEAAQPAAAAKPAGDEPTEWVIGVTQEAVALDSNTGAVTSPANQLMFLLIYDGLTRDIALRDGPNFKNEGQLAESYKIVNDTTWDFKLRQGVKWHDGSDFTAEDVKYTWDDYLGQEGKARYSNRAVIDKVEIVDPTTIRVTTKGPQAGLLDRFGSLPVMPKKAREAMGAEAFNVKPIGTGPYKVVEWVKGQQLKLEANPNYWQGKVFPEKLTIRPITDPTTRMAELKTGSVHIIQAPPIPSLKEIQSDPNLELKELKGARTMTYKFNITKAPYTDAKVRQAINYAVDRNAIIKSVLEGYGVILVGQFSEGWNGFDPNLAPWPYDPAKAKELLSAAGQSSGLELNFSTTNGVYVKDREIAEAVAGQLEAVGVKTNIIVAEPTKLIGDWGGATFDGVVLGPWGTSADPDGMLNTQYYKQKGYMDAQIDALIEKSRSTIDPAQRTEALKAVNKYIHEQALNLEIHSQSDFWAKRKNIQWDFYAIGSSAYGLLYRLMK